MARSGAVTVNFLADTSPLRRGVRSVNRSLKSVGRGANLQGVARDMSKMNRGIGSLVGGLGQLRMGWFGVGAAASSALVGAAYAIQRIGNEWDRAMVDIQRSTGVVVSEVEGMEAAFQRLAGSIPEDSTKAAAVFGDVFTKTFNDITMTGRAMSEDVLGNVENMSRSLLELERRQGISSTDAASFLLNTTRGPSGFRAGEDALNFAGQNLLGNQANELVKELSEKQHVLGFLSPEEQVALMVPLVQATGKPSEAMQLVEQMVDASKLSDLSRSDYFTQRQASVDAITTDPSLNTQQKQTRIRRLVATPVEQGGFGVTSKTDAFGKAFAPSDPSNLALNLSTQGLRDLASAFAGTSALADQQELSADTWKVTINRLEAALGPGAKAFIRGAAEAFETTTEITDTQGGDVTLASAVEEIGAGIYRNTLGRIPLVGGLFNYNPDTAYNFQQRRSFTHNIVDTDLATGLGGKFAPMDLQYLSSGHAAYLGAEMKNAAMEILERDDVRTLFDEGEEQKVREIIATELMGLYRDKFDINLDYQRGVEESLGRVDLSENEKQQNIIEATKLVSASFSTAADEIVEGSREAANTIVRGAMSSAAINQEAALFAAEAQRRLAGELAFMLADIASLSGGKIGGFADFSGTLSRNNLLDQIGWEPLIIDNTDAIRENTDATRQLVDGMIILNEGEGFRADVITSATTDADGLTSYTTSRGATTNRAANVDGGQIVHGGAQ